MRSWCQAVEERCVPLKLLLLLSTWRVLHTRQVTLLFAHPATLKQRSFEAAVPNLAPSRIELRRQALSRPKMKRLIPALIAGLIE